MTSAIRSLEKGSYHDLEILNNLYLHCKTSAEMIELMKDLNQRLEQPYHRSLNQIACALAIDNGGEHSLALQQLKVLSSNLNAQSTYVKAEYYAALGKIAYRSENPKAAVQHYKTGIGYLEKCNELEALQIAHTNLGLAYGALEQHETALVQYEKASKITQNSSPKVLLYLHLNKALSHSNLGQLHLAKAAFYNALPIIYATNDHFAATRTYGNLADIYILEDSLDLAESYLIKGRKTATKHGLKLDLIRFDLSLSEFYENQGDFEKAYFYLESHDSIRNSVHIEQAAADIVNLEKRNQDAIHKIEQKSLNETIRVKQQKNWILWGGIIILSIVCFVIFQQLLSIRRKNQVLLRKNLEENEELKPIRAENSETGLTDETLKLIQAFEEFLIDNRAFCKPDLTQERVAKKLETNRTYLSKAINDYYNMSYSRWLNELRIKESKKMLRDEKFKHFSIEGIATSVGFSSLSAFNSNFKTITGLTPSYFRNN